VGEIGPETSETAKTNGDTGPTVRLAAVRWSADTQQAVVDLVIKQARDAVTTFLDRDYVHATITDLETDAGVPVRQPESTIEHIGKALRFNRQRRRLAVRRPVQSQRGGQLATRWPRSMRIGRDQ
jgi:hypothetical protein